MPLNMLLTGGSGFLGSALVNHFDHRGDKVSLLLRPTSSLSRVRNHSLAAYRCRSDSEIVDCIREVSPDVVVHTACSYGRGSTSLIELIDANIRFGAIVLDGMGRLPTSSAPRLFLNIGTIISPTVSDYAMTKSQFAALGKSVARRVPEKLRFVNVLLEHMYGPNDDPSNFADALIRACSRHAPEFSLTSGEQKRDFIYIDDAVSALAAVVDRRNALRHDEDIELGSGSAVSIREFAETVRALCASRTQLRFGAIAHRENEPMHSQADLGRMRELGWAPKWSLEAGLKQTILLEKNRFA